MKTSINTTNYDKLVRTVGKIRLFDVTMHVGVVGFDRVVVFEYESDTTARGQLRQILKIFLDPRGR